MKFHVPTFVGTTLELPDAKMDKHVNYTYNFSEFKIWPVCLLKIWPNKLVISWVFEITGL